MKSLLRVISVFLFLVLLTFSTICAKLEHQQLQPSLGTADHQFHIIESPPPINSAAVVTWKGSHDNRWSNPVNWEGSRVPGPSDVARFSANSGTEVLLNADSSGTVAGLILEPDFHGTLRLKRDLVITNDLMIAGGALDQGNYRLNVGQYCQTSRAFLL